MAKSIEATKADIEKHQSLTDAMGLIDLQVVRQEISEDRETLILYCVPKWEIDACPRCGQVTTKGYDYPEQRTIHDAPLRGIKTLLAFDVRRLKCEACESIFTMRHRDVVPECTYTHRLKWLIADPNRKQAVQTLSEVYRIGYKTVESILQKAAEEKIATRKAKPVVVRQLGVDEQSNRKGQGNYLLVLTDLERRIVLDILPDRQKATLEDWLRNPPQGIDLSKLAVVATDLWKHYREGVHAVFGEKVKVVADRFHVMQNLHDAIHSARKDAQKQAGSDEERKQLKGLRYLLLKKDSKLNEKEQARLEKLKMSQPTLHKLTRLRQRLFLWYEVSLTKDEAEVQLSTWLADAAKLKLEALDSFCKTIANWRSEIVNFFRTVSPAGSLKA